jgi:hypothetical protein
VALRRHYKSRQRPATLDDVIELVLAFKDGVIQDSTRPAMGTSTQAVFVDEANPMDLNTRYERRNPGGRGVETQGEPLICHNCSGREHLRRECQSFTFRRRQPSREPAKDQERLR